MSFLIIISNLFLWLKSFLIFRWQLQEHYEQTNVKSVMSFYLTYRVQKCRVCLVFVISWRLYPIFQKKKEKLYFYIIPTQFYDEQTAGDHQNKPQINMHYNKTKGAGDHMTREYSYVRGTRRWPLRIFMVIIDMAALNACIIFRTKFPDVSINRSYRRRFLQTLSSRNCIA